MKSCLLALLCFTAIAWAQPDFAAAEKRYADGQYELLCIKPGKGSLSVDGVALVTKDAKPLPASD